LAKYSTIFKSYNKNTKDIKEKIKAIGKIKIEKIKTDDTWIRDFGAIDIFIDG